MPSLDDTGTRGRDAPVEELNVIDVAQAPARFRAGSGPPGLSGRCRFSQGTFAGRAATTGLRRSRTLVEVSCR